MPIYLRHAPEKDTQSVPGFSRQCSLTIRPSTRGILEDRRIVHPQDSSGQTQLMNPHWLPSKSTKGLTSRPKLVQVSGKLETWYASGSILYFGP